KTVNIEDCVMFRFAGPGILVNESNDLQLNIKNTVIRDNTGAGLDLNTSSGTVKASLYETSLTGNNHGLHAKNNTRVVAHNSVFSNNTTNGVFADASAGVATVRVWNSIISTNGGNGVRAGNVGGGGSGVESGQKQINNNTGNGVLIGTGGVVETFTNN